MHSEKGGGELKKTNITISTLRLDWRDPWGDVGPTIWEMHFAHPESIMCQGASTTLMEYRHEMQFCNRPVIFWVMEGKII